MLKGHGISMIDDTENTIINSALQSGRKLILSDAGKQLILNYQKTTKVGDGLNTLGPDTNLIRMENGAIKRKPSTMLMSNVPTTSLKTNKVIKILSAEEFNKMCGGKMANNTFKKVSADSINNGAIRYEIKRFQLH